MINAQPSRNPANDGSLEGMLTEILPKFLQNVDDMLPAKVISYDREANRVRVQPLIQMLSTAGEVISRQPVASVPVFNIGGGGFVMSFNLQAGDLGWIKANDRDISLFLQNYEEQRPNTLRKHTFSDALFFPDVMRGYTIADEDAGNCVIQNLDGTVKISLGASSVKITAPACEVVSDSVSVSATSVNIDASVVSLGVGGQPIARVGDQVQTVIAGGSSAGTYVGAIITGGVNTSL